jgi:hypothetical protein
MTRRVLALAVSVVGLFGLTLFAEGPFSADWTAAITLDPNGTFLSGLESTVDLSYETGPVLWRSYSNFQLTVGYLWQEFGVAGHLGAFEIRGDALFGPSTADFLYFQAVAALRVAGLDMGVYYALLSDAVLGGPADGFAIRVAGSFAGLDIVSITELGARIEDEDSSGIDIVHAATGLYRHYVTNPIVPGRGFTGEKLSVGGWSYACVGDIRTILYFTCCGFDFLSVELDDIDLGIGWLKTDLVVTYEVQTKSVTLEPDFIVGDHVVCFTPYFLLDFGASAWEIDGFELGGLALVCRWNGVTIKDLTVFDPGQFVITTEDYGSAIETLAEAIDGGHEYYADYWELLSVEVVFDGCCGGVNRMLVNTYFGGDPGGIFGWGMSYIEACVGLSAAIELSGSVRVTGAGLYEVGMGIALHW